MAFDKAAFGKKLAQLRKQAGLSQYAAGHMLDVSDKAVSKWENGGSFPSMETIVKISELYHIPVSELFEAAEHRDKQVVSLVLTGGPCAGKSMAISWIIADMQKKGWKVIVVPSAASELSNAGISAKPCGGQSAFQAQVMKLQLAHEELYREMAEALPAEKVLLLHDRGLMDCRPFVSSLEFQGLLRRAGLSETHARDRYDAVIHLVTTAKDAPERFNPEGRETIEDAITLDDKLVDAWSGHPRMNILDNEGGFESKMRRLLEKVANFTGTPGPAQLQRKYLIEMPDLAALENQPGCTKVEILQTYLTSTPDQEVRVRQRGTEGDYLYTKTVKKQGSADTALRRILFEQQLTEAEYLAELMNADHDLAPIHKMRYCICQDDKVLQVDTFPFWEDRALLEFPLTREDEEVCLPQQFTVIEEVTGDLAYRNHTLAATLAKGTAR